MKSQSDCLFCEKNFPCEYQQVSDKPKYWLFVLNINPQTDLHCLIVFNANRHGHVSDLMAEEITKEALEELGKVLRQACLAIRAVDQHVEKVLITSLNMGEKTEHLHFHLIPKRQEEKVMHVAKPDKKGGGMFFMGRKEIVVDTHADFLRSIAGCDGDALVGEIKAATKRQVERNRRLLAKEFIWPPR